MEKTNCEALKRKRQIVRFGAPYFICRRFSLSQLVISRFRYCRRRRASSSLPPSSAAMRFTTARSAADMGASLFVPQAAQ